MGGLGTREGFVSVGEELQTQPAPRPLFRRQRLAIAFGLKADAPGHGARLQVEEPAGPFPVALPIESSGVALPRVVDLLLGVRDLKSRLREEQLVAVQVRDQPRVELVFVQDAAVEEIGRLVNVRSKPPCSLEELRRDPAEPALSPPNLL